jgi:hypothetical protein
MKTARGIYHDIKESEYVFAVGEMKFYFSSSLYRDKFIELYQEEKDRFNQALNNVYKDKFNLLGNYLAWLRLYCLIEKRGFYIIFNGVEIQCPDDLVFVVTPTYKTKLEELTN